MEPFAFFFRYFISNYKSEKFKDHQYAMLKEMSKFLSQTTCRRAAIISHFTSKLDKAPPRKGCCDNCTQSLLGDTKRAWMGGALNKEHKYDFTTEAKKIFETVKSCLNCGASSLVLILRGSKSQRVKQHWMRFPTYGAGKDRNEAFWKELIRMLVNSEWLTETLVSCGQGWGRGRGRGGKSDFMSYSALGLSDEGCDALKNSSWAAGPPRSSKRVLAPLGAGGIMVAQATHCLPLGRGREAFDVPGCCRQCLSTTCKRNWR
ncbi:Werner syndrome ATP-dependent helicase [Chionoecetes opilio]|uniref:Werner syndrome ATP-dependent helicase n=1 Tax=Chionoecetes opilio TaxID=41210 RepID=A0A8J4Y1H2_CHIOP|nr:Werner syndrome ATP-dependent helicase [Chionoecetes opilio]